MPLTVSVRIVPGLTEQSTNSIKSIFEVRWMRGLRRAEGAWSRRRDRAQA